MKSRKFYELSMISVMFLFVILPVKVSAYTYVSGNAQANIYGNTCFDAKIFTNPTIVFSRDDSDTSDYRNPFSQGTTNRYYKIVTNTENCSGQWRTFDEACRDYDKVSLVEPFNSSKSARSSFTSVCKGLGYIDIVDYTGITASTCYDIEYLINGKPSDSVSGTMPNSASGGSYSSGGSASCDRNFDYMCRNYDEVIQTEPILKNNADYQRKLKNVCSFIKYSLIDNSGEYSVVPNPSGDKIFNATNKCGGVNVNPSYISGGNIKNVSSSKSYGALQASPDYNTSTAITHPGGHYNVQFSFSAHISITYYSYKTCGFLEYTTGNGDSLVSCGSEDISTSPIKVGSAAIPKGWDSHPSVVILTDQTDDRKIEVPMEYKDDNSCGGSPGGETTATKPDKANYTSIGGGFYKDNKGEVYKEFGGENGDDLYDQELSSGGGCKGPDPGAKGNGTSTDSKICSTFTADKDCNADRTKWTPSISCSTTSREVCHSRDEKGKCTSSTTYYDYTWSCSYKCAFIIHYFKHYETISESTCGVYKISQSSWYTFDHEHRFEPINEKFVHSDTVVGDYLYYVTDRGGSDFGERSCDLLIRDRDGSSKAPQGDHWSDLIYYRNVDEKNMFPGNRKRGRNWAIYDSNALKHIISNQTEPMYVITLSASAMRKVAKSTTLEDYIGWGKLLKETYNPIGEDGKYNRNGDYINSFEELKAAGVVIKRNDSVIKARNDYLLEHGFNKYSKSLGGV